MRKSKNMVYIKTGVIYNVPAGERNTYDNIR